MPETERGPSSGPGATPPTIPDTPGTTGAVAKRLASPTSAVDYIRAWVTRVRGGETGVLPVIAALFIAVIVFTAISPNHVFLSPANLVNLFDQSAVFIVLGVGEAFVLLLGEIDLSIGYTAAIGGIVAAQLVQPSPDIVWWIAIIAGLLAGAAIGGIEGTIITRLGMPAFVVTLAGYLILFGIMIIILGTAGGVSITGNGANQQALHDIVYGYIDPLVSWIGLAVIVVAYGVLTVRRDRGRLRNGLVAPPLGVTIAKIAVVAVAGIVVVAICNIDRGRYLPVVGVPYVIPIVLLIVVGWTVLLERMRYGRHMYATGGNAEAARRAGINVPRVRTIAFALCGMTAGMAGIIYTSWLGGMTTNINGGQLVLYAVAAAVIGGTSLFGGRGRIIHGLLGGLVIGTIYNGLYLLGLPIQYQLVVTGLVLLAAVGVDSLSHRRLPRLRPSV